MTVRCPYHDYSPDYFHTLLKIYTVQYLYKLHLFNQSFLIMLCIDWENPFIYLKTEKVLRCADFLEVILAVRIFENNYCFIKHTSFAFI